MKNKLLSQWWITLLHLNDDLLNDPSMPLVNMDGCLEYFHLALPELIKPDRGKASAMELPEPSFENLTMPILDRLRKNLVHGREINLTAAWAEKLLRFGEIRLSSLSARARKKWGSRQAGRLNFLQLTAFLLDYGIVRGDLRFLNFSLKIMDQKWLLNQRRINGGLRRNRESALTALFQIRLLLLTEYLMEGLKAGIVP